MQIIFFDSSSNIRSGRLTVFVVLIRCSQSQSSLYPLLWIILPFVQFSFHHFVSGGSTPLMIAHRPAITFSALLCRRTYSVLANFRNQLGGVAPFPFIFGTTDIDHYHLVFSSSSMPSFQPFIPAC